MYIEGRIEGNVFDDVGSLGDPVYGEGRPEHHFQHSVPDRLSTHVPVNVWELLERRPPLPKDRKKGVLATLGQYGETTPH